VTTRRTTANFSDSIPVATPVAAHVAKELGLDLGRIPANGKRITRADVERFAAHSREQEGRLAIPATPAARRLAHELRIDMDGLKGSGPQGRVQAEDVRKASETESIPIANQISADLLPPDMAGRPARIVPFTGMRKSIAERMEASYQQAPHISLTIDVDMTRFEEFRAQLNRLAETRHEVKISLTALLIRLTAWALEQSPYLNASLKEDQIYLWQDINIGVATALPNGLIVPVILQANSKPVHEISAILVDLTERAKQGKLSLVDVQHGTFTISNLGMFGIRQFQAIINPPESAILAVGAVKRIPVAINEQDEVAVRPMMSLTLSADHRLVDGASAARFLANLATAISTPETLLY
jgi:pyruvate dehydrogenase E2 component (dihydrolipoamide acetyltransferase)